MNKELKETKLCSTFEEMLMWTSYRYCIGRHTYVVSMAHEIAQNYYNRLTEERKEFTADDIRREIYDKLRWLPFEFTISRMYNSDNFDPIGVLFNFIENEKISSEEDFVKYSKINFDSNKGTYQFDTCNPTIKSYFSFSEIDDLVPWNTLASCFDMKNHKIVVAKDGTEIRCFKSWTRKTVPCEDKPDYVRTVFGWEPVWISLDDYLKRGDYCGYLIPEMISEVKDI